GRRVSVAPDGRGARHSPTEPRRGRLHLRVDRLQDPVDRALRLAGEISAVQRDDRQHRLIGTTGTDQTRADYGRAVRIDLLDPELRVFLGQPGETRGLAVHEAEVAGGQAALRTPIVQHEIGARGIPGKTAFQQRSPDYARRIRREEPEIVVLG